MQQGEVDAKGDMQYTKRGYQKQDISTIIMRSYNHHAWATNELTGCLIREEIGEFNDIIGKIKSGNFKPNKNADGTYTLEIGTYKSGEKTTLIITDGIHNGSSIDAVYKIYADNADTINIIKEFIYARTAKANDNGSMEEAFRAYASANEDTGFREYTLGSGSDYAEFDRQRRNGGRIDSDYTSESKRSGNNETLACGEVNNGSLPFTDNTFGNENIQFSIRQIEPPKHTFKAYKVFFVKDGKLYPPMVANPGGADTPVGVWLDADIEHNLLRLKQDGSKSKPAAKGLKAEAVLLRSDLAGIWRTSYCKAV